MLIWSRHELDESKLILLVSLRFKCTHCFSCLFVIGRLGSLRVWSRFVASIFAVRRIDAAQSFLHSDLGELFIYNPVCICLFPWWGNHASWTRLLPVPAGMNSTLPCPSGTCSKDQSFGASHNHALQRSCHIHPNASPDSIQISMVWCYRCREIWSTRETMCSSGCARINRYDSHATLPHPLTCSAVCQTALALPQCLCMLLPWHHGM
jgi:hypothetical protein